MLTRLIRFFPTEGSQGHLYKYPGKRLWDGFCDSPLSFFLVEVIETQEGMMIHLVDNRGRCVDPKTELPQAHQKPLNEDGARDKYKEVMK